MTDPVFRGSGHQPRLSDGNRVTFFDDGEHLFEAKLEAIRSARERVWIETFMFTPDTTGRTFLDEAAHAARRGCDVVLLFDQLGSHVTNLGFYRPLEEAGATVAIFNPLPPWRRLGRRLGSFLRHRDHRKIVIADDTAFCGGHNFTQSYMGPPPHSFYDMTVRLEGPCVRDLAAVFLDSFSTATGSTRTLPRASPPLVNGARVRVLSLDGTRDDRELIDAYRAAVAGARRELLLIAAYFVPDAHLRAPLIAAAQRGVDVTLLTAGATDVPVARLAGQHTYDDLLAAGIRILQLEEPQLHAKTLVVDHTLCMVGSFDVNQLQRRHTAEVAVIVYSAELAHRIHASFRSCLPRARRVTPEDRRARSTLGRALERLAYRTMRA